MYITILHAPSSLCCTYLIGIVMRSQTGAMLRQISLLVHMEADLAGRRQTGDVDGQQNRFAATLLHERHVAAHSAGSGQHDNGFDRFRFLQET